MKLGNLKDKAHPVLVFFVMSCIIITTGLLYILNKAEETSNHLIYLSGVGQYILD